MRSRLSTLSSAGRRDATTHRPDVNDWFDEIEFYVLSFCDVNYYNDPDPNSVRFVVVDKL